MNSRTARKQIVESLWEYVRNNPEDYHAYMTTASVQWFFRDNPHGMATIDQAQITKVVHAQIAILCQTRDNAELNNAHQLTHDLSDYLIQKLKDKGYISADDDGFSDDAELLAKHENDFSAWAAELGTGEANTEDK